MKLVLSLFVIFLVYGMVSSEEETPGENNPQNGGPRPENYEFVTIVEGPNNTITKRGLQGDPRCRWKWNELHNEGSILRCGCIRCVCTKKEWLCDYHFRFCPYFYCGGKIFNPMTQVCCCGDIYAKKANWSCCGFKYYNVRVQKCCSYSTIKNKGLACPRSSV